MNTLILLLVLGIVITPIWSSVPFESVAPYQVTSDARLPEDVIPTRYRLELIPNLDHGTFSGNIKINVNFKKNTEKISLHAHSDLDIEESTIKLKQHQKLIGKGGKKAELKKIGIQRLVRVAKDAIVVIYLKQYIKQGEKGELEINFSGHIYNVTQGLFKGSYQEISGEKSYWATYLRPNNTRRLFPCFDEPAFKAPFTVSIHRPKEFSTLFNTECKYTEKLNDTITIDHFETTKPMSTFSLGFVISQLTLANNQASSETGTKKPFLRIWGLSEIRGNHQEIYEKFTIIYDHLAQYFGTDIPLSKIDIIAIPGLTKLRINNWGLIVFTENNVLEDGYYALTVELIFQWLGSWVTPYWWSDDVFNLGLIRFLAPYTILKVVNDELGLCEMYPTKYLHSFYYGLGYKDPRYRRSIYFKFSMNTDQVKFVLRMLNYTLGTETLKKGMQNFIAERKYGTYTADDVWNSLTSQAHRDKTLSSDATVNEIAESWVSKDRLPALSVERNYQLKTAKITQRIYIRAESHDVPEWDKLLWWIPLVIDTQDKIDFTNSTPHSWMNEIREVTIKDLPDKNKFIIVNPEEIGPFLVNYDYHNWNLLAEYLQTEGGRKQIPPLTRAKLVGDVWNLALAGNVSLATALNMTLFIRFESNVIVIQSFHLTNSYIFTKVKTQALRKKFSKYVTFQLLPILEKLGQPQKGEECWKEDLRIDINTWLCWADYRPCIEEALARFKRWMRSTNPDAEDTSNYFMWAVMKWGTQAEWEFLLDRVINFPSNGDQHIRDYMINLLIFYSRPEGRERLLKIALLEADGTFSDADIKQILSKTYKILFYILSNNWDRIKERFENNTELWDKVIYSATRAFKTQEEYNMLSQFYEQRKGEFGSAEEIIQKSVQEFEENKKRCSVDFSDLPDMEEWLDNFLSTVNTTKLNSVIMDDANHVDNWPYLFCEII